MKFKNFVGGSYFFENLQFDACRAVNLYPEVDENNTGDDGEFAQLVSRYGKGLALTLPTGTTTRCIYTASTGEVYIVTGMSLYKISGTPGTYLYTWIGDLATTEGHVSIADYNGFMMIVDGLNGYYYQMGGTAYSYTPSGLTPTYVDGSNFSVVGDYTTIFLTDTHLRVQETAGSVDVIVVSSSFGAGITTVTVTANTLDNGISIVSIGTLSNAFQKIVDPLWAGGTQVVVLDDFFIWSVPNTPTFMYGPPETLLPLTIGYYDDKSAYTDNLNGMFVINRQLWLLGTQTGEIWVDQPSGNSAFSRINGPYLQQGCLSPFTVAVTELTAFWIAQSPRGGAQVYCTNGLQSLKISNQIVEQQLQDYGNNLGGATAFAYSDDGHLFYQINPLNGTSSWVYDYTASQLIGFPVWHERTYTNTLGVQSRDLSEGHGFLNGVHLFGDYASANVYYLDKALYTDNGAPITKSRTAPHIAEGFDRLFHKEFQVKCRAGVGKTNDPSLNPLLVMSYSDDGGETYGNTLPMPLGKKGNFLNILRWFRLGYSRNRVYKVSCTDAVQLSIMGADLTAVSPKSPN